MTGCEQKSPDTSALDQKAGDAGRYHKRTKYIALYYC